jgi:hypothetical protein
MNANFNPQFESEPQAVDAAILARNAVNGVDTMARSGVVNRTHRVVRARATVMQARRSHMRSLTVPLILCGVMLILTVVAVWSGLYQYQASEAAEAVQADVATLAASDANNHFLVLLLWFVPASLALLAAVWLRRTHKGRESGSVR